MKKKLALLLAAVLLIGLVAGCKKEEKKAEAPKKVDVNIAAMKGPTALGMLKLMNDAEKGETANNYNFTESEQAQKNLEEAFADSNNIPAFLESSGYIRFEEGCQATSVHIYTAYLRWCKDNLEKSVENNGMQNLIFDVRVPVEDVVEIKNNKRVKSQRKVYPGYVLVHMIETSESWYLVRNTRGVTGFVGPDSKPVALTPEEVEMMLSTQENSVEFGIAIGEEVRILNGALENFTGTVEDVDTVRQKLTVKVKMFVGRETPVEVDLADVEKI